MRVYELMSELKEMKAGDEVKVGICLSLSELMSGEQIDKDFYCLSLHVSEIDQDTAAISTEL